MSKFVRAASVAAISVTLVSAAFTADAGFAFGESNTAVTADFVTIDPAVIAADKEAAKLVTQGKAQPKVGDNGEIIFVPNADEARKDAASFDDDGDAPEVKAASLAELVRMQDAEVALTEEEHCLAGAVYFESKGESLAGQLAVARVVMARAKSGRFPTTLCGVVYQKSQFSFVRGGRMPKIDTGSANWRNAKAIAHIALDNSWKSQVEGAMFFHARYVSPGWRLTRLGTIDNHIFYR